MLPKEERLPKENFNEIMKKGGFKSSSLFSLRNLKNPLKSKAFSVVVSKKVAKTAVLRNKIRRRTYEVLQKMPENLLQGGGQAYSVILFAKKGVEKATFQEIQGSLSKLLKSL